MTLHIPFLDKSRLSLVFTGQLPGKFLLLLISACLWGFSSADEISARASMENTNNPLMIMQTSVGDIYLELFPQQAPRTVSNFIALAEAELELQHPTYDIKTKPHFYDGQTFHRVIPGFLIQSGSPSNQNLSIIDYQLEDEINAEYLGLDKIPLIDESNSLHPWSGIETIEDFQHSILLPLYRKMSIGSVEDLQQKRFEVFTELKQMNLMQAYENLGYSYSTRLVSRAPLRGSLAMVNSGPNTGNSEFFITVADSEWLQGKNTVFGQVIEGIEVVDRINLIAVEPGSQSPSAAFIYRIRLVN